MTTPKENDAPRYVVVHPGSIYYLSTRTGAAVEAVPGQVIDDLPPESRIDGKPRRNWVITAGLVQAYTGAVPPGTVDPAYIVALSPVEEVSVNG